MDRKRTDELVTGEWIRFDEAVPMMQVRSVVQVDPGIVVPIYRINLYGREMALMANGDRIFDVEKTRPQLVLP